MGDQTRPDWIVSDQDLGTGVYAVKGSAPNKYRYRYVSNVGYDHFKVGVAHDDDVVSYQWVPHLVASEGDVINADCGEDLPCLVEGEPCVIPGCCCIEGICGRKENA